MSLQRPNRRKILAWLLLVLALPLLALVAARLWSAATRPASGDQALVSPILDEAGYPWVCLRDDQALADGETLASVIAVGDIMLGRGVPAGASPWRDVSSWLPAADLTLGNLESVLTDEGVARSTPADEPQPILLRAGPEMARPLAAAGFDILGLANNHALDYGPDGLAESVATLNEAGLATAGLLTPDGANQALIRDINGIRLAFLAFNAVPDPRPGQASPIAGWDPIAGPATISAAGLQAQAVIVSVHWGFEYQAWSDPYQETIAASMTAAGADLILGHHPHVVQNIAVSDDRVVAYSLGNFVFDQGAGDTRYGLALRSFFDQDGLRAVQALPLLSGPQPRLLRPEEDIAFLDWALPEPSRLGLACDESGCRAADAPQTSQTGLFYAGQIDLTGDGRPETVRRAGTQITIYEGGVAVWQSPAGWSVVDAALGDPNDDGRYEIMLALWQEDEAGYLRSQPYIVGYRGGEYTLLWGGRPVADPIQEVAVGDVDGDGSDELVVIEEMAGGSQAVSIWRWTGWTFTLRWRSDAGLYRDLVLEHDEQGAVILSLIGK